MPQHMGMVGGPKIMEKKNPIEQAMNSIEPKEQLQVPVENQSQARIGDAQMGGTPQSKSPRETDLVLGRQLAKVALDLLKSQAMPKQGLTTKMHKNTCVSSRTGAPSVTCQVKAQPTQQKLVLELPKVIVSIEKDTSASSSSVKP